MQIQYFKSAWGDIKNSPGWFGKMCLLALLNFIPIFGQIVTFAYLYGWAREIAWGTHEPLPAKIFSNDDGKFWRRGWFILVLTVVFALVPQIVMQIGNAIQVAGMTQTVTATTMSTSTTISTAGNPVLFGVGGLVFLIGWLGALVLGVLAWVGSMRIAIYDRLSAGFQLGKIWGMVRQDTKGILKIFGMQLLVGLIVGIVLSIIISILIFIVFAMGMSGLVSAGYTVETFQHMTEAQATRMIMLFISSVGVVGFIAILVMVFLAALASVYICMLVYRAMGYWTMQFDVPHWLGQDDPMPFERGVAVDQQPQQPMGYQANMQQPYQPQQPQQPQQSYQTQQPYHPYGAVPVQPQQPYAPVEPQQPYAPVEPQPQPYTPVVPQTGMQPDVYTQPIDQSGVVQDQAGMPQGAPQQVDTVVSQPADAMPAQPVEQPAVEDGASIGEGESSTGDNE